MISLFLLPWLWMCYLKNVDDDVVAATYLGTNQFVCVSPPRALTGTRQLRLVNGGTELRSSLPFRYEEEDELVQPELRTVAQ